MGCGSSKQCKKEGKLVDNNTNLNEEEKKNVEQLKQELKENNNDINQVENEIKEEVKEVRNE